MSPRGEPIYYSDLYEGVSTVDIILATLELVDDTDLCTVDDT